ncbi:MAG: adenylate/guanylate cyclase domain-containing protein [Acidimicrobiia bacterium]|jgi:adenylate cyclase
MERLDELADRREPVAGVPQERISLDTLARSSGVDLDLANRLATAGIVRPGDDGLFGGTDITRMRLLRSLVEAGFSLDDLTEAARAGTLNLDYIDLLMPRTPSLVEFDRQVGPAEDDEGLNAIRVLLGSEIEQGSIREDDLALLRLVRRALGLGAPMEHIMRALRATALSAQHIVALQREFVDEVLLSPAIERTGSPTAALAETAEVRREFRLIGFQLVGLLMERFADDAVFRNIAELTELNLRRSGVECLEDDETVVFVDVSNYTKLSREAGDQAAAEQAALLTDTAQTSAQQRGGRLVKSLGDAALVHFTSPAPALDFALDMVSNTEKRGLWTLHAGVNSGPMLRRDGDYFGSAVNIASRVADAAQAGEVVVTKRVVDGWQGDSVRFDPLGPVPVKNVDEPVELFRASIESSR